MRAALVCIARNEDRYIREWYSYHLKLGFDQIFIYTNDWDYEADHERVTTIPFDGIGRQVEAYNHFIVNHRDSFTWAAFLDVDEFLVLRQHRSINHFLEDFSTAESIAVNWRLFGDNHSAEQLTDQTDNGTAEGSDPSSQANWSVLQRFIARENSNPHIRVICRLTPKLRMLSRHHANCAWVDTAHRNGHGPFNHQPDYTIAQINHYFCKTRQEFALKIQRGRADGCPDRELIEFESHNKNDVIDTLARDILYNSTAEIASPKGPEANHLHDNRSDQLEQALTDAAITLRWDTGSVILQADRLPHQVLRIRRGQVRLVADDPLEGPVSYLKLGRGSWLGWLGLERAEPCETVLAADPVEADVIPAERWLQLRKDWPELSAITQQPAAAELATALIAWWSSHPYAGGADARMAVQHRVAQRLQAWQQQPQLARLASEAEINDSALRTPDRAWIWSGVPQQRRLLSLDLNWLSTAENPPLTPSKATSALIAPPLPQPLDPATLGLPTREQSRTGWPKFHHRCQPNQGVESALICLERLCHKLQIPVPVEALRQALQDAQSRLGGVCLMHIGQLAESIGLEARPLHMTPAYFHRLDAIAIFKNHGHFAILQKASAKGWLVCDPSEGERLMPRSELQEFWPDGLDLMIFRLPGTRTVSEHDTRFNRHWYLSQLKPYRGQLGILLLTGFSHKLLELIFPLSILQIIDVVVGGGNASLLLPITIILGLTAIVNSVLGSLREVVLADLSDRIDTSLGSQVISHLFRLPLRFFDRRTVGDLAARLHDLQQVRHFLTDTALSSGLDLIFLPILLATIFTIQPVLATIVLIQVPLLIVLNASAGRWSKQLLTKRNTSWSKAQGLLVEVLAGIRTVKSQNFATVARWRWLQRYRTFAYQDHRLTIVRTLTKETSSAIVNLGKMFLFVVAAWLALQGSTSIGAIFAVYLLSSGITTPLINLSRLSDQYRDANAALTAVSDVIGQPEEESIEDISLKVPLSPIHGEIRFQKVSFSYGLDSRQLLNNLDLTITAGSFVGLVGLSGSGKSSLVQLIDALYVPQRGRIFIDDLDIAHVQLSSLRSQIGFVPQESILFDGSILDNIRLNNPGAPLELVMQASKIACAHEFIIDLPQGYASRVGERGGGLSGGQKQRIAIARMILHNPRLVILDEATSALDPDTEKRLVSNIRSHFHGRTLLFVTHRLGNLKQADRILVMDQGQVIEEGSWQELINLRGAFTALARQQHEDDR